MNAPARPEPYECDLPVRWSDQDVNGHVNNARVVTLLEELRIAAYLDWTDSTPDAGHPRVVRTLSVDYRHPVHHCTPLTGRLWVSRLGRSSFVMQHALLQRQGAAGQAGAGAAGHQGYLQLMAEAQGRLHLLHGDRQHHQQRRG